MTAPRPELTAFQRRYVERAREVATADVETIAAEAGSPSSAGDAFQLAIALGIAKATIRALLDIIDELTAP